MQTLYLFLLAVIPGLALTIFFRQKDRFQREPWSVVRNAFLLGMLMVVPALVAELIVLPRNAPLEIPKLMVYMIAGVGLIEELCKWAGIRIYAYRHKEFDELADGMVYGAATAAGFATLENVFYVFNYGFATGIIRAVYSVPMHIFTGAIIGYWVAKRRFDGGNLWKGLFGGLGFGILAHGIFNVGASFGDLYGLLIMTLVMAALLLTVIVQLRYALAMSRAMFGPEAVSAEPVPVAAPVEAVRVKPAGSPGFTLADLMNALLMLAAVISAIFSVFLWLGLWLLVRDGEVIPILTWPLALVPPSGTVLFLWILWRRRKSYENPTKPLGKP